MVAVHYFLGSDTLFACAEGDGHTVLIAATHHHHVFAAQAQEAGIYVGRYVDPGKMADVDRTIGIGQGSGYKSSLESLFH